jgi:6-hydroxycyclohex-1-ene-1-carbonyl-CoA dehydrogenase
MTQTAEPLVVKDSDPVAPGPGEVRLKVAGCGVCHTDLGFLHGGVQTRRELPLTLGHEVAATVEACGSDPVLESGESLEPGQAVVVPAVLPCGACDWCRAGRENICTNQLMPGNDMDGGFSTHMMAPARFLVPVGELPADHRLEHLSVVADAVTTPYQALRRAGVGEGDHVVVVGAGGIGIYGVQIAAALGARVLAVDVSQARIQQSLDYGAGAAACTEGLDGREARKAVTAAAKKDGWPRAGWKVFEMSGSEAGQQLAFSLLSFGGTLGVIGYTRSKIEVRLSNLMAFDADAFGSWGCRPAHYPAALELIRKGKVQVKPFVSFHPLDEVNEVLDRAHHGALERRAVLVPATERGES